MPTRASWRINPRTLERADSDALAARIMSGLATHGFGLWAIELPGITRFAGYAGLQMPSFQAKFTPCIEIGWRLAHAFWGFGYATEAARAVLTYAFTEAGFNEVVAFTVQANTRSWSVMQRLGMRRSPLDDFQHPNLPEGHRLRPHIVYRVSRAEWAGSA